MLLWMPYLRIFFSKAGCDICNLLDAWRMLFDCFSASMTMRCSSSATSSFKGSPGLAIETGAVDHTLAQFVAEENAVAADGIGFANDGRSVDDIFQLADVSRPVMRPQFPQGFFIETGHPIFKFAAQLKEKMLHQHGNIFGALVERRECGWAKH